MIKKGDFVKVIAGKDRGNVSEVLKVLPKKNKVLIRGVNIKKKHVKPSQKHQNGGIISFENLIDISNVVFHLDGKGTTRISHKVNESGKKQRFSKKFGVFI